MKRNLGKITLTSVVLTLLGLVSHHLQAETIGMNSTARSINRGRETPCVA
jgi:hypothetical protein